MDALPSISSHLAAYGLRADKRFGQHFLLDRNITDNIAKAAGDLSDKHVMEIGPGPGGLTRSLLDAGAKHVSVVEMDNRFIPMLEDIEQHSDKRLHIIQGDGLKVDPSDLPPMPVTRIVSNLPYNVGTKMLINWLTASPLFWDRLVLMFQKEVAERIVATPGTKAYGRLAILSQSVAHCGIVMNVPASAFTPPPKVDSAVAALDILPEDQRYSDLKSLSRVTEAAFGQRRKMLRQSLKRLVKDKGIDVSEWLESCGIDPTARAETLSVKQFQDLATSLAK